MIKHPFIPRISAEVLVEWLNELDTWEPYSREQENALHSALAALNLLLATDGWIAKYSEEEVLYSLQELAPRPPRL